MKRFAQITIIAIMLIVLLLTIAVLFISPNQFKPVLKNLAKEQGIALDIGNMGWTFWPRLGVSLADVSVAAIATPDAPVATFSDAGLMLAVKPLLKGEFEVDFVRLTNAKIALVRNEKGVGNWEALIKPSANPVAVPDEPVGDAKPLHLAIERIALVNATLTFNDETAGSQITLRDLNLDANDVNTNGRAFALRIAGAALLREAGATSDKKITVNVHQNVMLSPDLDRVRLDKGTVDINFVDKSSADIRAQYSLDITDLKTDLAYSGHVNVEKFNARHWLRAVGADVEMADAKALTALSFSADVTGSTDAIALTNTQLQLDKTTLTGDVAINDFVRFATQAALRVDAINLDGYLPPPAAEEPAASNDSADDTPLPLAMLRDLDLDIALTVGELEAKKWVMQQASLTVKAKKGALHQTLSAHAYEGQLTLETRAQATMTSLNASFDSALRSLEIAPVMAAQELDKKFTLSGAVNADAKGRVVGASVNQLIDSMDMAATFSGAQVRLSPLNIEQQICQAVNFIAEKKINDASWDAYTEMRALQGMIIWKDQKITLKDVNAGVSQLAIAANGVIDLRASEFAIGLPFSINEASANATASGCNLSTELTWLNRSLTLLQCSGRLETMDLAKDCGVDKSALASLTKDYAAFKLKEKHGDKLDAAEQKLEAEKQKLTDKANEKLGLEQGEELNVKSALTGLLKKKLGASSSAASSSAAASTNESSDTVE